LEKVPNVKNEVLSQLNAKYSEMEKCVEEAKKYHLSEVDSLESITNENTCDLSRPKSILNNLEHMCN